eukprot:TRINITY_DN28958_c0_g4_i1.p1 TRINITY_DN28958_c0_g4~~TRINITY_DN28958_c0_g4_i1.p1  ORF type:complete len:501 (+),score=83.52 TRINITY_DN28958_c0_g4_i1:50-1552(+)
MKAAFQPCRVVRSLGRRLRSGACVWKSRHLSSSALANAMQCTRLSFLRACVHDSAASSSLGSGGSVGHWSAVETQAETVARWPSHPLGLNERLSLVESLVTGRSEQGAAACLLGCHVMLDDDANSVFELRSDGTAKAAVLMVDGSANVPLAIGEASGLLLRGYAVSFAAAFGSAELDELGHVCAELPAELLQAVALPSDTLSLPSGVQVLRQFGGGSVAELWQDNSPPRDFGGVANGHKYGLCTAPFASTLLRTNFAALEKLSRARFEFSDEALDLLSLLSTEVAEEAKSVRLPGLPPPRWTLSAYDRGVEEVNDLLDLLWASHESGSSVELAPANKHFVLGSSGTTVPEDLVKAAVVSAMSPYNERMTLHAISLGADGFAKDPLRGFRRVIQSGRSGLQWQVVEHETAEDFARWLANEADTADVPPSVLGSFRGREADIHHWCAVSGGVYYGRVFEKELFEQLSRWTTVRASGESTQRIRQVEHPVIDLKTPLPQDDGD